MRIESEKGWLNLIWVTRLTIPHSTFVVRRCSHYVPPLKQFDVVLLKKLSEPRTGEKTECLLLC
jgi:hypothetical protein